MMPAMTPEERGEKAASLKKSGTANCCQSVLLSYADLLPMDADALRRIGAGFAVGMGTMEATCGALVAAGIVAGHRTATRQEAVRFARDIHDRFRTKCGATICKDLKGRDTGRVLCECPECCRNAVLATEEAFDAARA